MWPDLERLRRREEEREGKEGRTEGGVETKKVCLHFRLCRTYILSSSPSAAGYGMTKLSFFVPIFKQTDEE